MNKKTYNLLEDVISASGRWTALEVVNDSIYIDFSDVQLYNISYDNDSNLSSACEISIRFAENSLFSIFYNKDEDIEFIKDAKGLDNNFLIELNKKLDEGQFKFQNIDFSNKLCKNFQNELVFLDNINDANMEIPDFILSFSCENIAICIGGDSLNFFNNFESLNDNDILELSNRWSRYYLDYWIKKSSKKQLQEDPICELHPLKINKKYRSFSKRTKKS
ncbi:hypothetical protein [uncultured Methanobrevibacter sp.]|uniref:hypothetical protein n=1 Tax=uncultured Methanobrevibacter sp. TaxID=253161 RepID=UPI0025F072C0|nr:hypothetical protein [uncultured Methanobrevibacter sp.]